MKKWINNILFAFFILSFSTSVFAEKLIRLSNDEWSPFISKNLKHYGMAARIVTESFALEGVKVEYVWEPWKRAYSEVQHGNVDGSIGWTQNADREKVVYFSNAVFLSQGVFFHLKNYPFDWKSIDDLKGLKIGATLGYNYGKEFQEAEKAKKIIVYRVKKDVLNFRKLLIGRIHIFPLNPEAGYEILRTKFSQEEASKVTNHPKPYRQTTYHLILSKKIAKSQRMLKLFNNGLKKLKESGKYDEFIKESRNGDYAIMK